MAAKRKPAGGKLTKSGGRELTEAQRLERDAYIVRSRLAGRSLRAIGQDEKVKLSHERVRELIDEYMKQHVAAMGVDTRLLLQQELERLDVALQVAFRMATDPTGDPNARLRAVESMRRVGESRVRWLGLAASGPEEEDPSLEEVWRQELQGLDSEGLDRELASLGVKLVEIEPVDDDE